MISVLILIFYTSFYSQIIWRFAETCIFILLNYKSKNEKRCVQPVSVSARPSRPSNKASEESDSVISEEGIASVIQGSGGYQTLIPDVIS